MKNILSVKHCVTSKLVEMGRFIHKGEIFQQTYQKLSKYFDRVIKSYQSILTELSKAIEVFRQIYQKHLTEAYLEPIREYMMDLFCKNF